MAFELPSHIHVEPPPAKKKTTSRAPRSKTISPWEEAGLTFAEWMKNREVEWEARERREFAVAAARLEAARLRDAERRYREPSSRSPVVPRIRIVSGGLPGHGRRR